ncbi:MAG: excinuclease ABC subunit UvrC [Armatimonadetes bacterium]|nr:excinuclease ABC subunit UvrC [Armatimonadota bacterium]
MARKPLNEHVTERLKQVPTNPGCYIYKDEDGRILYVGKAVNLRSRVRSYFRPSANHSQRIERLVRRIRTIDWMVVDSELEALVLECNLIKEHRPHYNVLLRDDKSYPYIQVTKENFPRVQFTRRPRRRNGKVFGPYTSAFAVRDTIKTLHKAFPLIPCGKSWSGKEEQKPCLYYHIKQCMAPCAGLADKEEYSQVVNQVVKFLEGKEDSVINATAQKMEKAAENLDFELAASLRDRIHALRSVQERQKVLSEDGKDRDIVAVVKDDRGSAIQMMYIRGGRLIGQQNFMLQQSSDVPTGEAVQAFVEQYYSNAPEIPREVLLPVEIESRRIIESWLRNRKGAAVTVEVPQGGEGLRLVEMAAQNAELALTSFIEESDAKGQWAENAIVELSEALELPKPAYRIEGYDISNIQGKAPVGSMVVTENGEAAKGEYRRFRVKYTPESPDDFAMMNEVLLRRFRAYLDGNEKFSKLPDLIMIDGGKGQLSSALRARDQLGLDVPMVGLAKRQEIIFVPVIDTSLEHLPGEMPSRYTYREVILPLNSPGLLILRRLRDEAHRFALSYHRKLRDKRVHGSILDEIPGVGPKKRRLLLRTFGSIEGIRRSKVEEIAAVPTFTMRQAQTIHDYLRPDVREVDDQAKE